MVQLPIMWHCQLLRSKLLRIYSAFSSSFRHMIVLVPLPRTEPYVVEQNSVQKPNSTIRILTRDVPGPPFLLVLCQGLVSGIPGGRGVLSLADRQFAAIATPKEIKIYPKFDTLSKLPGAPPLGMPLDFVQSYCY